MHGMTYLHWASSGTCITDSADTQYSIYKRITGESWEAKDFAIIAGGVNDYTTGKPLGEYDSTDITTFYGALRGICTFLSENHPNMAVIFITPINCTHDAPNAILPLNHYRNAIFEVATEYGFNVVDGTQIGFPDERGGFQEYMMADYVHPTDAGYSFYAKNLCGILC
jgi:lysophospholipase L1-like esterase